MNSSFLDWMNRKQQIIQEFKSRLDMQSYDWTPVLSQEDIESGINHWVINNAGQFLKDVVKMPTQKQREQGVDPKLKNTHPNIVDYSLFKINDIDDKTIEMSRPEDEFSSVKDKQRTYAKGKKILANISDLRDVTESFKEMGLGNADIKNKYFINIAGSRMNPEKIDEMLRAYMNLTRVQAGRDNQDTALRNMLGGERSVKQSLNQGANKAKDQMWIDLARRIEAGQNVSKQLKQALMDDDKSSKLDNPRFVNWLKYTGLDSIIQYAKWSGISGNLTSEEQSLVQNLKQMNQLIKSGILNSNPDIFEDNPEVDAILNNPNARYAAQALGMKELLNFIQQKNVNDTFMKKLRQQQMQGNQGAFQQPQGATSMFRKAENCRHWKSKPRSIYLTENRKFYSYYPK